jgi:uncharacterized membrane protein
MEKKTKYDTNPLDPDFVRRTEEVRAATSDVRKAGATEEQTRRIDSGGDVDREAPTRYYPQPSQPGSQSPYNSQPHSSQPQVNSQPQANSQTQYDDAGQTSYPSVFIPPTYQPPQNYQPPTPHAAAAPFPYKQAPTSRTLPGIGIPENLAMILPYLPFPLVGAVPGVVELLLMPRTETRARFHAAQGLALHLAVLIIGAIFSTADGIISGLLHGPLPFMLRLASTLFTTAATIFFIISMIRVWKGEPHVVAPLAEATRLLDEKLAPRK